MVRHRGKLQRLQGEAFLPKRRKSFSLLPSCLVRCPIRDVKPGAGAKNKMLRIVEGEKWGVRVFDEIIEPLQSCIAYYIQTYFYVRELKWLHCCPTSETQCLIVNL